MATGRKPASGRKKNTQPHATHLKVPNGGKEAGYKAGEMFGVNGHRTHAHQPCVFDLTEGELQCPYCAAGLDLVWRGYVPVWDRDWTLRYVLVNEEYFCSADAIPIRAQVIASRGKNPISPIVLREEKHGFKALPDAPPYNTDICMRDICLLLWKNEPLNRWYAKTDVAKLMESLPKPIGMKMPTKAKPADDQAARLARHDAEVKAHEAGEVEQVGNVINRLIKPSANGKADKH